VRPASLAGPGFDGPGNIPVSVEGFTIIVTLCGYPTSFPGQRRTDRPTGACRACPAALRPIPALAFGDPRSESRHGMTGVL